MAKVTATILGADEGTVLRNVETIRDVKEAMECPNHVASIEGETVDDDEFLEDGDFVDLAPDVKGG